MTLALAPTGASLGEYERLAAHDMESVQQHTRLRAIADPALRGALHLFDSVSASPMSMVRALQSSTGLTETFLLDRGAEFFDVVSTIAAQATAASAALDAGTAAAEADDEVDAAISGRDDAVAVVDALTARLDLPVRDVLAAAGIRKSTFYTWKAPEARRPRVASQGRLWVLAQAVEDLEELVGGSLRGWLLADPARLPLLRRGELDALLRVAEPPASALTADAPGYPATYGVGGDHVEPDDDQRPVFARGRTLSAVAAPRRRIDRRPR
ncbi:hypothetical protein [Blastococcus mobilis]|uniref:Uncharacterized protein n=1 Tax=Blastococcus mobilis TaxID=1938746 RepID=A0A238XL92_9ACTN|nr:hypothetical protein [Blastococcus mobilis]SNR59707.1 hypothetical protein SAMN06272737_114103 [Blastococcus mobilis]